MKKQLMLAVIACCGMAIVPTTLRGQGMSGMKSDSMGAMKGSESPAKAYGSLYKMVSQEIISAAEAMPADKYGFAPTSGNFSGVRTFAGQVRHLTEANYGFFNGFGIPVPMKREQMESLKTKEQLVQALKDSFAFAEKAVNTITPENAWQPVGSDEMRMSRAGLATFCLAHANDHYGQMVVYLRMNGIVPPASQKK